jgi:hypothetical protein
MKGLFAPNNFRSLIYSPVLLGLVVIYIDIFGIDDVVVI